MRRYDEYKDSGVEWLAEIPNHWNVTRLKFLGSAFGGLTYSPRDIVENEENGILVLRSSNIQNDKLSLKDNVYVNVDISEKLKLRKGDIVICSRNGSKRLIGKNILIDEEMEGNTFGAFMMVFRSENCNFLYQFFNSPVFKSQSALFLTATINQLTSNTLNNFYIGIPDSFEEQTQIANYLDYKTAQLDSLISKKEQLIELLKEERTALINDCVTGKIIWNGHTWTEPAEVKDSGIEWLGEIPKHWEVKKLKYLSRIRYGLGQPPKQKEGGLPIIRATNIFRGEISKSNLLYVDPDDLPMNREPILNENDILIVRSGAYTADSAIVTKEWAGSVTGYDIVLTPLKVQPQLLAYALLSTYLLDNQLFLERLRAAQPHLNSEEIGNSFMLLPSVEEQGLIVAHIEHQLNKVLVLKEKLLEEILLLKEYKTALISEVVTGKVDVRNEIIPKKQAKETVN